MILTVGSLLPWFVALALWPHVAPVQDSSSPAETLLELLLEERKASAQRREAPLVGNSSVDPEAFMTTPEIIRKNGYPVEEHTVETEDGYLIQVHRIPSKGTPVLIMHGLICSSIIWVDNTVNISLAYLLSDLGYDVWLGNVRGNSYARKHRTINPSEKKFWDFTLHEHAQFDISAIIDYIVEMTSFQKLLYVGHSLGTAEIFALLSQQPEYNQKVKGIAALAPISVLSHIRGYIKTFVPFADSIKFMMELIGQNEVMDASMAHYLGSGLCRKRTDDGRFHLSRICKRLIDTTIGEDTQQLNESRADIYLNHVPAGTSLKALHHLAQLVKSQRFAAYDYGSASANKAKYKTPIPPEYDVREVVVPVALFWGQNDFLSDPRDVEWLAARLPNVHLNYRILYPQFNHADFIWAVDARHLLYSKVVEALHSMADS